MPDSQDYRKFVESQLQNLHDSINTSFSNVNDQLHNIQNAVDKTNGKVLKLQDDVVDLKIKAANHIISCPQTEKISKLQEEIADYSFYKRNPKLFIISITVAVILLMVSFFEIKNILSNGQVIKENGIKIEGKR